MIRLAYVPFTACRRVVPILVACAVLAGGVTTALCETNEYPNPADFRYDVSVSGIQAGDVFPDYEHAVRKGDYEEAAGLYAELKSLFDRSERYTAFWDRMIPEDRQWTLVFMEVCGNCRTGECAMCRGKGQCGFCDGTGVCPHCKGKAVAVRRCTNCICKACAGRGICLTCRGGGKLKCPKCRGTGMGKQDVNSVTCPKCGGQGSYVSSLGQKVRCIRCRGSGKLSKSSVTRCATCAGKGWIQCTQCRGAGKCQVCKGRGRAASCPVCKGTGLMKIKCDVCHGTGKCPVCRGSGACRFCKGSGSCSTCNGTGMILDCVLPVDRDWMNPSPQQGYYMVRDQRFVDGQYVAASGQVRTNVFDRTVSFSVATNHSVYISRRTDILCELYRFGDSP